MRFFSYESTTIHTSAECERNVSFFYRIEPRFIPPRKFENVQPRMQIKTLQRLFFNVSFRLRVDGFSNRNVVDDHGHAGGHVLLVAIVHGLVRVRDHVHVRGPVRLPLKQHHSIRKFNHLAGEICAYLVVLELHPGHTRGRQSDHRGFDRNG